MRYEQFITSIEAGNLRAVRRMLEQLPDTASERQAWLKKNDYNAFKVAAICGHARVINALFKASSFQLSQIAVRVCLRQNYKQLIECGRLEVINVLLQQLRGSQRLIPLSCVFKHAMETGEGNDAIEQIAIEMLVQAHGLNDEQVTYCALLEGISERTYHRRVLNQANQRIDSLMCAAQRVNRWQRFFCCSVPTPADERVWSEAYALECKRQALR